VFPFWLWARRPQGFRAAPREVRIGRATVCVSWNSYGVACADRIGGGVTPLPARPGFP
jgi:hypothetical protein